MEGDCAHRRMSLDGSGLLNMANSRSVTGFACLFLLLHTCCAVGDHPLSGAVHQVRTRIDRTLEDVERIATQPSMTGRVTKAPISVAPARPKQAPVCSGPIVTEKKSATTPSAVIPLPYAESSSTQQNHPIVSDHQHDGQKPPTRGSTDSSVGCHPVNSESQSAAEQQAITAANPSAHAGTVLEDISNGAEFTGCHPLVKVVTELPSINGDSPRSPVPAIPNENELRQTIVGQVESSRVDQVSYSGFQPNRKQFVDFSNVQAPFFGSPLDKSQNAMSGLKYLSTPESQVDSITDSAVNGQSNAESGTYVDDLQGLISQQPATNSGGSYLNDLNQLLGDQPAWILTHGQVMDLGPGSPQENSTDITYLHELQSLVGDTHVLADCRSARINSSLMQCATTGSLRRASAASQSASDRYYEIPKAAACVETGGDSVAGLFTPIGEIQVKGVSSSPPQPSKNAKVSSLTLVRPPNEACSYLQLDIPMHYLTSGYGVRRAPRNTHRFYHNPLYFEDPNLERCGQSKGCLTTACSMVHFTAMSSLLPYLTTADPPRSCVAALPDCPTCHSFASDAYFPEWSWKAATVQAAAVTGLVFVIP